MFEWQKKNKYKNENEIKSRNGTDVASLISLNNTIVIQTKVEIRCQCIVYIPTL